MIIRAYIVTLFCCFIFCSKAQQQYNLVPNYSFEEYTHCPSRITLESLKNSNPDYWYKPDTRGSGYLNACANGLNYDSTVFL